MFTCREYVKAASLEEAFELNKKRNNVIIGGMQWLKMGSVSYGTAIDLSGLGLDKIEETDEEFRIGCMVTLRDLEESKALNAYCDNAVKNALSSIVGVQFRNLATLGGTIAGKYGFSDVISVLYVMNTQVLCYAGAAGIISRSLGEYIASDRDNSVITGIVIRKKALKPGKKHFLYQSVRRTRTDFPVLTCAAFAGDSDTQSGEVIKLAIGARPGIAAVVSSPVENGRDALVNAASSLSFGSNLRGSEEYRRKLAGVLAGRAYDTLV